ncbi:MAG: hypothetical protein PF574_00920 [Candidatus Delongbacteria bacterium]|jgi:hypothetical protein|nr:hypothetical protein [Candidatus Delongbacteria bacterium]
MKKFVSILVLVSIAVAFAQIKFGMDMRVRSELQNLNSTDADTQIYDKRTDLRFRPYVDYNINENLFVKAVFEIGDIQFGDTHSTDASAQGGGIGTDGVNTETKNLYLSIKPSNNHKITIGLLSYQDPHGFIFNADVAGILWNGEFNKYSVDLGWFAPFDENEVNEGIDTYSYGTTFFALGLDYKLNERISFGLSNYLVFDRNVLDQPDPTITVNEDEVSIFIAPRIVGDYGKIKFDAQFVVNNRYYDFDVVSGDAASFSPPHAPDKTGTGMSVKSTFEVDKKLTIRANFLYRGCQTMYENFETFEQFYDTGLEIINQNPVGIDYKDPMDFELFEQLGIALPAVLVDYKVRDNIILTGGLGVFMFDQNYAKVADTMYMGSEFDIKAKVTLYDNLNIIPYFALFVPDVGYSRVMDLTNPDHPEDLIMKLGTTLKYSF